MNNYSAAKTVANHKKTDIIFEIITIKLAKQRVLFLGSKNCVDWLEKKLDGNYTRMLRAILNKSWRQHPTKHQLYGLLPPITKTIQVRQTRHAGHCWRSRDRLISDVFLWTPHMAVQKQDGQHEHTFSNYVRIWDAVQKTCQRRWTIGKSGERVSGISVLPAWHDDDDDKCKEDLKPKNCYYYLHETI